MTMHLDESQIEAVSVDYFRILGYGYAHGPAVEPDSDAPERASYGQVVLRRPLASMDTMDEMAVRG